MKDIIKTAGILILKDGNVLMVRHTEKAGHKTGTYGIPAGRFQDQETAIQCAIRELQEETGLVVDESQLIQLPEIYTAEFDRKDGKKIFSLEVFLCRDYEGALKKSEENIPERVKIDDIKKVDLLPNMEKIVNDGRGVFQDI